MLVRDIVFVAVGLVLAAAGIGLMRSCDALAAWWLVNREHYLDLQSRLASIGKSDEQLRMDVQFRSFTSGIALFVMGALLAVLCGYHLIAGAWQLR